MRPGFEAIDVDNVGLEERGVVGRGHNKAVGGTRAWLKKAEGRGMGVFVRAGESGVAAATKRLTAAGNRDGRQRPARAQNAGKGPKPTRADRFCALWAAPRSLASNELNV